MVGLDALPTYKRVVAWFPGPRKDMEHCFQQLRRLNQGLNTSHWRVYECKREPDRVHLVLSIDSPLITAWHRRYFPSRCQPRRKKIRKEAEEAKLDMVSNISFIQANLQHSIAASRVLTRTVNVEVTDMALIPELWWLYYWPKYFRLYPVLRERNRPITCILVGNMNIRMLTGFSSRDLVALLINYNEGKVERCLVSCSALLP